MKSFALILCLTIAGTWAFTLSDSDKAKLKEIHDKCQGDPATHVDIEFFKKAKHGQKPEPPANLGAHLLCMHKGAGFIKEDGSLDKQVIRQKVEAVIDDKTQVDSVVVACAIDKPTPEETSRHLFDCFLTKHVAFTNEHHH